MTEKAGNRLTERRWMNPEEEVKKRENERLGEGAETLRCGRK